MSRAPLVVVGTSWGGLNALTELTSRLPTDFPAPILIVQHRSRDAGDMLKSLLQEATRLRVTEVEDKDTLEPANVYIAPANYHVLVEGNHLSLTTDPKVKFSRPSIDVTFMSAGDAHRERAIGVVLTGANDDGSRGLRHIVDRGGRAIVQDPETAEVKAMPAAAAARVPEAELLPLARIPQRLVEMATDVSKRLPDGKP